MKLIYVLLFSSFFLTACSDKTETASQVADKYWHAIQMGDNVTAKQLVSKKTQNKFDAHIAPLKDTSITNFVLDNPKTTITTIINPEAKTPEDEIIFETRLTLEEGQWKVDLNNTQIPSLPKKEKQLEAIAEDLSKTIQKKVKSMESVMGEGMNLLNNTLKQGSDEMGKSMLDAMRALNKKMQESINKMKQRRQKAEPAPKQSDGNSAEGLI